MNLIENLKWRYATKKFNSTKKIAQKEIDNIITATHLTASSSGMQPYVVLVITNPEIKNNLVAPSMGQQMVADCSHLLVFAAWDNYTEQRIDAIFKHTCIERNLPENRFDDYTNRLKSIYLNRSAQENFEHTARQSYIALGTALIAAAELKIDATPMEGFYNDQVDEILNLKEKGLKSVSMIALGYRDSENDWLVNMKKVRQPLDNFLIEIK